MAQPDTQARFWTEWHTRRPDDDKDAQHARHVDDFLAMLAPMSSILDLGCGKGGDSRVFAQRGHRVIGIDIAPTAIERAKEQGRSFPNLSFLCRDLSEPLPFQQASFDAVFSYLGLHYFNDAGTRRVFSDIRRVLRSGGWLYFVVKSTTDAMNGEGAFVEPNVYERKGHLRHFFSAEYVNDLADETGFSLAALSEYEGWYYGHNEESHFLFAAMTATERL